MAPSIKRKQASAQFCAGTYSTYNEWRERLAELAGWPKSVNGLSTSCASAWNASGGPVWELINFADNEGIFCPGTSAKLAADFAEY